METTVRDYFAGQAMVALLIGSGGQWTEKQVAKAAGRMADAMLAERAGAEGPGRDGQRAERVALHGVGA